MQPVTPLREQQHHHLPLSGNSRPRRSNKDAESSSRRSSRLQQAAPIAGSSQSRLSLDKTSAVPTLLLPISSPQGRAAGSARDSRDHCNGEKNNQADTLAPPLALTRKRTRAAQQAEEDDEHQLEAQEAAVANVEELEDEDAYVGFEQAQVHIKALQDFIRDARSTSYTGARKERAVEHLKRAFVATANATIDAVEALRDGGATDGLPDVDMCADLNNMADVRDLRDLFANGRALYNATTTALAAPAEIPSKRARLTIESDPVEAEASTRRAKKTAAVPVATMEQTSAIPEPTTVTEATNLTEEATTTLMDAAHLETALATPKQPSRTTVETQTSRRPTSKRSAAVSAIAAITNDSTSKRRSASKSAAASASTATTTTATGGSASRRSKAQKDDEKRHQQEQDALDWKKKYKRAFKSFVFYFDGFDAARKREAEKCVKDLGAQVESFFSKQISHVVTTRPIPLPDKPSALNMPAASASLTAGSQGSIFQAPSAPHQAQGKENAQVRNSSESPLKQSSKEALGGTTARRAKTKLGAANPNNLLYPMKTPPKIKALADFEKTESKDILVKAQSFGMKLWNVEKLQRVLERLIGDDSPSQGIFRQALTVNNANVAAGHAFNLQMNGNGLKPSLPSLLRAEALTGSTYERDLNTLRPDFHYFNPKNGYILVEDSSGEFQPAHVKEYSQRIYPKPGDEDRDTEWPTLWGGQEGRQAFYKPSASYKPLLPSLQLIESNERGCAITTDTSASKGERRQLEQQGSQIADPPSYLAASGNSQIITSNIQSGTSTRSGQILGANGNKATGSTLNNGYIVDKRLARLGSKNAHIVTLGHNSAQSVSTGSQSGSGSVAGEIARRAAKRAGHPNPSSRLQAASDRAKMPKPEPKKPGYCENCRVRFEDFKVHTRTKKHRRFALDNSNWRGLDELFAKIKRPINPELYELYVDADMGDDIPSDIEASDKEEEAYSSEDECMDDEDSGFASNSFTFQAVPASESRKRKRYPSLPSDYDSEAEREELRAMKLELLAGQERVRVAREAGMARDRAQREQAQKARVDIEEDVVGTSEEEQALETATDEEEMCEEEEEEE